MKIKRPRKNDRKRAKKGPCSNNGRCGVCEQDRTYSTRWRIEKAIQHLETSDRD